MSATGLGGGGTCAGQHLLISFNDLIEFSLVSPATVKKGFPWTHQHPKMPLVLLLDTRIARSAPGRKGSPLVPFHWGALGGYGGGQQPFCSQTGASHGAALLPSYLKKQGIISNAANRKATNVTVALLQSRLATGRKPLP